MYLDLVNEDEGSHDAGSHDFKDGSYSPDMSHDLQNNGSPDLINESPEPAVTPPTSGSHDPAERHQVIFSFSASSEVELSVEEGEWVWLIAAHDLTGNSEWWLVKNEGGAKGYVPANYLQ